MTCYGIGTAYSAAKPDDLFFGAVTRDAAWSAAVPASIAF